MLPVGLQYHQSCPIPPSPIPLTFPHAAALVDVNAPFDNPLALSAIDDPTYDSDGDEIPPLVPDDSDIQLEDANMRSNNMPTF